MPALSQDSQKRLLKPEQAAAAHALDRHLSVTAGPGAGKTFVLVERYLEILRTKNVSVDNIVAITFTNRAANEMRQRVRNRIDELLRKASPVERQNWLRHKRALEGAVITTIHGLCSRLLHEFPVEANLDPRFVLLDEHQAAMMLEAIVDEVLADAIHHGNEKIVQLAQGAGRATLAHALGELYRRYRGEGLSLTAIEKLTAANHSNQSDYLNAFKELEAQMGEFLSARKLTRAAEEKRGHAMSEWPRLRAVLASAPTERNIAAYCQAIEDFREIRPNKNSHPVVERLDASLWGSDSNANDKLSGRVPSVGFDLLARDYSLALVKLLRTIDARLDDEKQKLSVLDFDDLQLRALQLLERPEVMARVAERYRFFLVDEFQDTNGLQRDLMNRLALSGRANLFIVGDRKQSVYGFRGADVDVFSEMTQAIEACGGAQHSLHLNFRSQKPLIDCFNFLFSRIFRQPAEARDEAQGQLGYVEHEPSVAERGAEHKTPLVELLVTAYPISGRAEANDNDSAADSLSAHECDAEQVAARILELTGGDVPGFRYGDIAILLRAFTGVWTYESALRRAGIPYLTVQGKGFYQREEITDLIQVLRFLDNTTDELALAAILRSPLCGISDNALLALRCGPRVGEEIDPERLHRRNLFRALHRHREIQFIDENEHRELDRAAELLDALVQRRNRYGIAETLRYAVTTSEFMTVNAAHFDGAQRIANVEKLFRLAEQFVRSGHLIRDFVHYVEEFEAVGGREGEGQLDEKANVVRLMTIHQAKGLEFPVVIVPDLHREPARRESQFILDRHKGLTVRIPDGRGQTVKGALFNDLRQRQRWREEFEGMRLLYVAATRAEDRLIFTGSVAQKELKNLPHTNREQWLAWLWQALELEEHATSETLNFADEIQFRLVVDRQPQYRRARPAAINDEKPEPGESRLYESISNAVPLLKPIEARRGQSLRRFSVTQLITFQRCARQYYLDRLLRTPGAEERAAWNNAEAPEPPANLTATLKGAVIHRFCETFREGDVLESRLRHSFDEVVSQRRTELAGRTFDLDTDTAIVDLLPLAEHYLSSGVYHRVSELSRTHSHAWQSAIAHPQAQPGLWSELRFRLRRPLGILTGTIDKLLIASAAKNKGFDIEVIDFKTNRFRSLNGSKTDKAIARPVANKPAPTQGLFDFEAQPEELVAASQDQSIEEQIKITTRDYQLQMQSYALALRELLPADVKVNSLRATLHFIDPNIETILSPELLSHQACAEAVDEAMDSIAALDGTLDPDRFAPFPATHCRICNFVDLCPAGRDWLKAHR